MNRLLWVVIGLPLGIVLIALGVANRAPLTVSLDPFRSENPALSIHPPLFLAFFTVLAAGVLLGGLAVWISHHKVRRALHRSRMDLYRVSQERDALIAQRGTTSGAAQALSGPRRAA